MHAPPRLSTIKSFAVAIRGCLIATREQPHLQFHFFSLIVANALAAWLQISAVEWLILLLTCGLVISVELLNTAIETVVDLASPQHHELARNAKDIAAGAVLFASIIAAVIGAVILGLPLLQLGWTAP